MKDKTGWPALMVAGLGLALLVACGPRAEETTVDTARTTEAPTFSYDQAAFPEARPWTSDSFETTSEESR